MNIHRRNLVMILFFSLMFFMGYMELDKYVYSKTVDKAIFEITHDLNFTGIILVPLKTPRKIQSLNEFRELCKEDFKLYYFIGMDEYHIFATNATITDVFRTEKGNAFLLDPLEALYQFTFKIMRVSYFPIPKYRWVS